MAFRLLRAWWGASATARRRHGALAVAMVCARRQATPSGLPVALAVAAWHAWQCRHTAFAAFAAAATAAGALWGAPVHGGGMARECLAERLVDGSILLQCGVRIPVCAVLACKTGRFGVQRRPFCHAIRAVWRPETTCAAMRWWSARWAGRTVL